MADEMQSRIKDIDIGQEMRDSFMDYAMSIIVSRALPDVRDGLKPVHRRILVCDVRTRDVPGQAVQEIGENRWRSYREISPARGFGRI